ncbi:MAG: GHKL domain-containing protein [Chitinophagales bacterium]|nr:GHKL domain-containing protein [Chitinophagales bacterium]
MIQRKDLPLYTELVRNLTNCKTDVRNELDKIASWFKRTNNKSINDFTIQLPIDSTLTTIKRIYKDYSNLNLTTNIKSDKKIEGEFFQHFCYIFQNLIHNVLEHANLASTDLKILVEVEEREDKLMISIENNFSNDINISELNDKISNIITALDKEKNSDLIRNESGTGYIKINKTLYHDLRRIL